MTDSREELEKVKAQAERVGGEETETEFTGKILSPGEAG